MMVFNRYLYYVASTITSQHKACKHHWTTDKYWEKKVRLAEPDKPMLTEV